MICSIQKSDVLCFQVLLSFVSTFFVFSAKPPDFHHPDNSEPCRTSPFQAPAGTSAVSKGSNFAFNARIDCSIWVGFGFVFSFVSNTPFFVFNDILASVVSFLVCFQSSVSPPAGSIPVLPRASWPTGPRLRQCVRNVVTSIGYHFHLGLSRE